MRLSLWQFRLPSTLCGACSTVVGPVPGFADPVLFLSVLAAFFYWAAFPPWRVSLVAWLVPVVWACLVRRLVQSMHRGRASAPLRSPPQSLTAALAKVWCTGYLFWLVSLDWLCYSAWWMIAYWQLIAAMMACFWVAFVWSSARITVDLNCPQPMAMAMAWTATEWFRRGFLLGGFPFGALEHSQYRWTTVIQVADIAGEYGLGFLMMAVGGCAAEVFLPDAVSHPISEQKAAARPRRYAHALAFLGMTVGLAVYGKYRLSSAHIIDADISTMRTIAVLQSATEMSGILQPPDVERAFDECLTLSVENGSRADLVVWPEATCKWTWTNLKHDYVPAEWRDRTPEQTAGAIADLRDHLATPFVELSRRSHTALLLNLPIRDLSRKDGGARPVPTNSVLFVDSATGIGARYNKRKLVPILEVDPIRPYLGRDVLFASKFQCADVDAAFVIPQRGLSIGGVDISAAATASEHQFIATVNICFDSFFPDVVRTQLESLRRRGLKPDVVINVSNDADSDCERPIEMHLASHVFRAVENRIPYVVASNCGSSAWIDESGTIIRQGRAGTSGCVFAVIKHSHQWGTYRYVGELLPQCCVVFVLIIGFTRRIVA